nr:unnamed protein product [Callosobruchus chinensis]
MSSLKITRPKITELTSDGFADPRPGDLKSRHLHLGKGRSNTCKSSYHSFLAFIQFIIVSIWVDKLLGLQFKT